MREWNFSSHPIPFIFPFLGVRCFPNTLRPVFFLYHGHEHGSFFVQALSLRSL